MLAGFIWGASGGQKKKHPQFPVDAFFAMARPERFELPAPRFVVLCSIQLSYGRNLYQLAGT
jgi:hypothetical protein